MFVGIQWCRVGAGYVRVVDSLLSAGCLRYVVVFVRLVVGLVFERIVVVSSAA